MTQSQRIASQLTGCISGANHTYATCEGRNSGRSKRQHAATEAVRLVDHRLGTLGLTAKADFDAFWNVVKVRDQIDRGQAIAGHKQPMKHFTVLLKGVTCFSTQHEGGARQIYSFHYPGHFLGLHGLVFPSLAEPCEVQALTRCSIGTIERHALEQAIQHHPALGRALWRAAVIEVNIFRQRLVVSRRPALERVAHLLCEQLACLASDERVIPLTQIEIADAVGLSVVHINRVFQELRELGVLSKQRLLQVVNTRRLQELAAFDADYLDPGGSLTRWQVRIEG